MSARMHNCPRCGPVIQDDHDSICCPRCGDGPPIHEEEVSELWKAAKAVVDRWDTPLWKNAEPTAHVINRLRQALKASERG